MSDFFRLLGYTRSQRKSWLVILILTIVASGLAALQPWPLKLLIDHVLGNAPWGAAVNKFLASWSIAASPRTLLVVVVAGGLLLFIVHSAVDAALAWVWTSAGRRLIYQVAEELFNRLQRRSLLYHKRSSVADLMSRVTVDSWSVYQVADTLLFGPANALLTMALMIFLMGRLDFTMTLLALALAPFMVGASFLLGKPLRAAARLKREVESRIQSHIQQTLTGLPVVQAFTQEERESQRFQSFATAAIRHHQRGALLGSFNSLSSGLIATLGSGAVLWLGARHVLEGKLSIGSIWVFLVYLNSLQAQIKIISAVYTNLQGLSAQARRVVEVLDSTPDLPEKPQAASPALRGGVEFRNVIVGYTPGAPILKEVSFKAEPGQTIALVGPTGAGKTTLVNLIPRFLDPWEGAVLLDGRDARELRLKGLREQIGLVLQEPFLFALSVRENIAYGKPDASLAEIEAAAKAARAHDYIMALPEGYDTVIGERGATLSGGERQRISIARALLRNPPVLILDEPTSALDAQTEHLLLQALKTLMHGRTTFVIAHRLSTVRHANSILVLQDGRIVERGTHSELLALDGQYARLHRLQNSGGLPAAGPRQVLGLPDAALPTPEASV